VQNNFFDRWFAEINYHTPREKCCIKFFEFKDLGKIIDAGPNWFEIESIKIYLGNPDVCEGVKAYRESFRIL
jgi:hypothetical protein